MNEVWGVFLGVERLEMNAAGGEQPLGVDNQNPSADVPGGGD